MFNKMIAMGSGGESVKTHEETITISGNNTYTINCGFKPKFIYCFVSGGSGNYVPTRIMYVKKDTEVCADNGYSDIVKQWSASGAPASTENVGARSIPYSAAIQSITDTGFTFKHTTSWGSSNTLYVYAEE